MASGRRGRPGRCAARGAGTPPVSAGDSRRAHALGRARAARPQPEQFDERVIAAWRARSPRLRARVHAPGCATACAAARRIQHDSNWWCARRTTPARHCGRDRALFTRTAWLRWLGPMGERRAGRSARGGDRRAPIWFPQQASPQDSSCANGDVGGERKLPEARAQQRTTDDIAATTRWHRFACSRLRRTAAEIARGHRDARMIAATLGVAPAERLPAHRPPALGCDVSAARLRLRRCWRPASGLPAAAPTGRARVAGGGSAAPDATCSTTASRKQRKQRRLIGTTKRRPSRAVANASGQRRGRHPWGRTKQFVLQGFHRGDNGMAALACRDPERWPPAARGATLDERHVLAYLLGRAGRTLSDLSFTRKNGRVQPDTTRRDGDENDPEDPECPRTGRIEKSALPPRVLPFDFAGTATFSVVGGARASSHPGLQNQDRCRLRLYRRDNEVAAATITSRRRLLCNDTGACSRMRVLCSEAASTDAGLARARRSARTDGGRAPDAAACARRDAGTRRLAPSELEGVPFCDPGPGEGAPRRRARLVSPRARPC